MTLLLIIFNKLEVVIVKFYTAMEFFIRIWIKDDEKGKYCGIELIQSSDGRYLVYIKID
jgi:uncharacterized protein YuzE